MYKQMYQENNLEFSLELLQAFKELKNQEEDIIYNQENKIEKEEIKKDNVEEEEEINTSTKKKEEEIAKNIQLLLDREESKRQKLKEMGFKQSLEKTLTKLGVVGFPKFIVSKTLFD